MKGLFDVIFSMSDWLTVLLIVVLVLINYGAEFFVKHSILKVYKKTQSPEEAMNKLRIYNQYFLTVLQIVTIIPVEFLVVKYFAEYGKVGRLVFVMCAPFIFLMIVSIGQLLIINKTYKLIRGTTESLGKQIKNLTIAIMLILFPIGLISIVNILINEGNYSNEVIKSILSISMPFILIIAFNLLMPMLYPKLIKATILQDEVLGERLNRLFDISGLKRAKLYLWPTKENKIANALVMGLGKHRVFVTDYYIENAETEEIEAIIAHEVGHLKYKHIIKRLVYIFLGIGMMIITGFLMEWYEDSTLTEINTILGLAIMFIPFILYMTIGLLKYYRKQEKQADKYVIDIGIKPEVMISALIKLAKLNHMATKMKKLDEKLQTHPSIAKRIRYIEEISGYNYEITNDEVNKEETEIIETL